MAYKFLPYRSVYRDPMSVKINELLRERYINAFAADTMTQQALAEMTVAPEFAGDTEKAAALRSAINARSAEYAESGRYEMLGTKISRDAAQFQQQYAPLLRNYQLREADKENARKTLSPDEYDKWEKWSVQNKDPEGNYTPYAGLEYDDKGFAIQSSYYQPKPFVDEPDFNAAILKEINALPKVKEGGQRAVSMKTGPNGERFFVSSQGQIIEQIKPEDIEAAISRVFDTDDAKAYLKFSGEINTWNMDEMTLREQLGGRLEEILAEMPTLTPREKNKAEREANAIRSALESGAPNAMRETAKTIHMNRIVGAYADDAQRFSTPSVYGGGILGIQYDDLWLAQEKAKIEAAATAGLNQPVVVNGDMQSFVASIAAVKGIRPEDVKVTEESLATAVEDQKTNAVDSMDNFLNLYDPQGLLSENFKQNGMDVSNIDEMIDFIPNLDNNSITNLASFLAGEGGDGKTIEFYRQGLLKLQGDLAVTAQLDNLHNQMIDEAYAAVRYTPAQIHKDVIGNISFNPNDAIAATGDGRIIVPEGDNRPPQVLAGEAIALEYLTNASGGNVQVSPNTINAGSSQADAYDILQPILTNTIQDGGLGLDERTAREILDNALEIVQQVNVSNAPTMTEYGPMGDFGTMQTVKDIAPDAVRAADGVTLLNGYAEESLRLQGERHADVDDELNRRAHGQLTQPIYDKAFSDTDGNESEKLTEFFKGKPLSIIGAATDLKDPSLTSVSGGEGWRRDSKGESTKVPIENFKIDDVGYTVMLMNNKPIGAIALMASTGSGEDKVSRTVYVPANEAVKGYMDMDAGDAPANFGDAILGTTPASVVGNLILATIAQYPGANVFEGEMPGGLASFKLTPVRDDKGFIRGYEEITITWKNGSRTRTITPRELQQQPPNERYRDVIEAAAFYYMYEIMQKAEAQQDGEETPPSNTSTFYF